MAFGHLDSKTRNAPMADINMTPLIDVMLVLLVIFIITAPLLTHAIKLNLPSAAARTAAVTPKTVTVSIDAQGKIYWDREPVDLAELKIRFARAGATEAADAQPEIHLRADQGTRYQQIAEILSAAQQAGLARVGFVTEQPK